VDNRDDLRRVDAENADKLLGVFAKSHLDPITQRESNSSQPSLREMTVKALEILARNPSGFFLMVENGLLDLAHHFGRADMALEETLALDAAVEATMDFLKGYPGLIVVTADHSHPMTMSGKFPKHLNVLGEKNVFNHFFKAKNRIISGPSSAQDQNGDPVPILAYANGPSKTASSPLGHGLHGGEDVPVFAEGPMASLFRSTHEQTHVAHAIALAACIGPYADDCDQAAERPTEESVTTIVSSANCIYHRHLTLTIMLCDMLNIVG